MGMRKMAAEQAGHFAASRPVAPLGEKMRLPIRKFCENHNFFIRYCCGLAPEKTCVKIFLRVLFDAVVIPIYEGKS